jgi:hypothetical protein
VTTETTYATDVITDEQWDAIDRRLDGGLIDDSARRAARRRRWPWFVAAAVVVVAAGVAAGWFAAGLGISSGLSAREPAPGSSSVVHTVVQVALVVGGYGLLVTGLIVMVRSRGTIMPAPEATAGMPRSERLAIRRTLAGREPVDPSHLRALRRLATLRLDQVGSSGWTFGGLFLITVGQVLERWVQWTGSLFLVALVLYVVAIVAFLVQRRRWRAFLAAHPDAAGEHHAEAVGR